MNKVGLTAQPVAIQPKIVSAELLRLAAENADLKATVADLRRRLGASEGTVVNE